MFKSNTFYTTNNNTLIVIDYITDDNLLPIVGKLFIKGTWVIGMWNIDGTWDCYNDPILNGMNIKEEVKELVA